MSQRECGHFATKKTQQRLPSRPESVQGTGNWDATLMPSRKSRTARSRNPLQERSRLTVDSIRKAALQILERQGVRGLTPRAIQERAGVGVASLERYVPNREASVPEGSR